LNWGAISVAVGLVIVAFTIHPVVGVIAIAGAAWFVSKHC